MSQIHDGSAQPADRGNLVYLIMVMQGIGILMPWNIFINAKSYFEDYKLNDTTVQEYRQNFMSYIAMASQYPNFFMSIVNIFCQCGRSGVCVVTSIVIMVLVFIVTVVLAFIDSSNWSAEFFWITLALAVVLNGACGIYQNSMLGATANLPVKYTNAVIFGNNLSGTFFGFANILAIALAPDIKTSAIYFFVTAIVVLLVALGAYFMLSATKFYRYFQHKQFQKKPNIAVYWKVLKEIWYLALCEWFVFFVSLSLFPQIQSNVKRLHLPISDTYWTPVFCFLSFNLFAMLGNLFTECLRFPGPRWVCIPVFLRVGFIPLFLMCNFRPDDREWTVLIDNDYVFVVAGAFMAFTSGYFGSLVMMYAPKRVTDKKNAGVAGVIMVLFLVLGFLSGINVSRLLAMLV